MSRANGYERVAAEYIAARSDSGTSIVEKWARALPKNAKVLDVGAGHGQPVSSTLLKAGHHLSAIDASPSLVAAFRKSFPDVRINCETVEESDFFGETFDGIISIGLMFLLLENEQQKLIQKVAQAIRPKGRFLFSAPKQICEWTDILTGQQSYGLGEHAYTEILNDCDLSVLATHMDEGGSHYYDAEKRA